MAATMEGILMPNLREKINSPDCRILMVGSGGIGCELLKNLVLTGFKQIVIIDLDTIDISNLNRQFLFRKEHVGSSKAKVAREGALLFNPDVDITALRDDIMSSEYGTEFFKKFSIVLNALDNRAARNHVNRMCLAANVPLIESGTAGYLGQVDVIKKGVTECYECYPKPAQKSYPGCTIRNTPSEPIHCIVWAKHLFNPGLSTGQIVGGRMSCLQQFGLSVLSPGLDVVYIVKMLMRPGEKLYGEDDPDQDVSPDAEDPEAVGAAGKQALELAEEKKESVRVSTRSWAESISYDPVKLFNKFFRDDIQYLLSMENLWKKRRPPVPVEYKDALEQGCSSDGSSRSDGLIRDQIEWSLSECVRVFSDSVTELQVMSNNTEDKTLVWDKDTEPAMNFVASAANLRSHIFNIPRKTKFEIKSMAGNIIPAIATTNAVIAGVIVMEALKVLQEKWDDCRSIYLNRQPNERNKLLIPMALAKPNPKCYVCSSKPQVTVQLNLDTCTVKTLEDKIMKAGLGMVAPDVEIDDGKGTILISSEGDTEDNWPKCLSTFGLKSGSRLKCDDFLQEYFLLIDLIHKDKLDEDKEFEIVGDVAGAQAEAAKTAEEEASNGDQPSTSTGAAADDDDDDLIIADDEDEATSTESSKDKRRSGKRKAGSDSDISANPLKKPHLEPSTLDDDDDVLLID